jgi:hypothetical protein
MKTIQTVLLAVYSGASGLVFLGGVIYPDAKQWSYCAVAACLIHLAASLFLMRFNIATAARISSWCCQAIGAVFCCSFLYLYYRTNEEFWLLGIAATFGGNMIAVLVLCLNLVRDSAPWAGKGSYGGSAANR